MKNKIIDPEFPKKITTPLLYRITKMIIFSLVIFCLFLLVLYVVGNYQDFQDYSQYIILRVLFYNEIFTALLTVPVIVEDIFMLFTIKKKTGRIISILLMMLTIAFCFAGIFISEAINVFSGGL